MMVGEVLSMPDRSKKRGPSAPRYRNVGEIDGFLPPVETREAPRGRRGRQCQLDGFLPPEECDAEGPEILGEDADDDRR